VLHFATRGHVNYTAQKYFIGVIALHLFQEILREVFYLPKAIALFMVLVSR
jgi:hypothetical protein